MLITTITTAVILMTTATTIFYQTHDRRVYNQTTLAAVKIISNHPEVNTANQKMTDHPSPNHVNTLHKKSPKQYKRKLGYHSQRINIAGYRGQTFVYGEVILLKNDKLEGFIYHPDNRKTYVYGEKIKDMNTMNLYDSSGNLYQMFQQYPAKTR